MVNVMKTKANTALNKIHKLIRSPPGQKASTSHLGFAKRRPQICRRRYHI